MFKSCPLWRLGFLTTITVIAAMMSVAIVIGCTSVSPDLTTYDAVKQRLLKYTSLVDTAPTHALAR